MKNEVVLGGRVTKDLVSRQAGKGRVANFSIAHNREYVVRTDGVEETKSQTSFVDCVAWNKLVDNLQAENVGKGTPIEVTGYLVQEEWEDKDGNKRRSLKINVREFVVLNNSPKKVTKVAPPSEEAFESVEVGNGETAPF
jgi:single-strand DNA-binding protein